MRSTPTDEKVSSIGSSRFQRIPGILVVLIPISAVILLILISPDFSRRSGTLFGWLLWLVFFLVASLSDETEKPSVWYSYRNLAVIASWLTQGLVLSLTMILAGAALVLVARLRLTPRRTLSKNLKDALDLLIQSVVPLLASALVYTLLNGQLPLMHVDASDAVPLLAALFTDFAVLQIVRSSLYAYLHKLPFQPIWAAEERPHLLAASMISPLMIVLPLISYGSGMAVFTIILGMIAAYAVRYHETIKLANSGEKAYAQSAELLQKLAVVSQAVRSSIFNVDRDVTLKSACQAAVMVTEANGAAIFLLDDDQITLTLAASAGLDAAQAFVLDEIRKSPNHPIIVENAAGSPLVKGTSIGAFVQLPLDSGSVPLGYMLIYHTQPHIYKRTEIELLEIMTSQLVAALDNIQLLNAMEFHTFEMTHLVHLSRISSSSLELNVIASEVSNTLLQMTGVDSVVIALLENSSNRIHVLGSVEDKASSGVNTPAYMLPQFPEVQVLRGESEPGLLSVHLTDSTISPQLKSYMERDGLAAFIIVPMIAYQETFGVIFLGSNTAKPPTKRDMDLIETAANQIATQVFNARVYSDMRKTLERQLQQLALIEDIVQHMSSTHDFSAIINDVFEAAIQSTQADVIALALLTEADDFWVIEQDYEDSGVSRRFSTQSKEQGIIGQVGKTGEIVLTPDNSQSDFYLPPSHHSYASSLAVPLQKNGEVVGVLNVESKRKHFFNMSQADFLKNLGGHAMISIENNRLLEELRYQIDILTSLRELSLVLSSALDIDSVAHAVLQAANQMLGSQCAALFRYDYLTKELTLLQKADQDDADYPQEKIDVLLQTVRAAATSSETRLVEDVAQHYAAQLTGDPPYASIMATPIIREGLVNEVLVVGFNERQQFEVRDVTTLTLLGSQAAGHLENTALLEKIRNGNNRMKAILDSTRDGIILLDERGKLIEVNPAAQRLMGIPLGEYVDLPFVDTLLRHAESDQETPGGYPREELLKLARIQRLDPEAPTRREFTRKVLPNQALYIQESGSQVVDEHRQNAGRLLVLRDITDEKLVEVYREEITSMAVHDLRSPLASIIDALRIAVENLDKPGGIAIGTQTINLALVNADKLMSLVNSLLELRRSRQMELTRSVVPVEQLVDAARETLASTAEKAHIPVEVHMPAGLPLVNVDADKIRRVLINLLDNALRYTPAGKPVQVWVIPDNPRGKLTVQVADSGPGIPDKERERIFEQFWQVKENRPVRGTKGNGIGLTFCQRVMEAHGERIWVEARGPLPGACFAFTLPIQPTIEAQ